MKDLKSKRTSILAIILVGLLVVAYKTLFVAPSDDFIVSENVAASVRVEATLRQVESINFDTNITNDPKFKSLKSIEIPLVSLPVGRSDPFSRIFGSN